MIAQTSLTQSTLRSRAFHTRPTRPPGANDARELGDRAVVVEPVERLRDGHRVERGVAERELLGGAREHRDAGNRCAEEVAHARHRFGGDEVGSRRHEQSRSLPVPAARSTTRVPGPDAQVLDEPRDRVGRVRRPRRLVVGRIAESRRGNLVDHAPQSATRSVTAPVSVV